MLAVYNFLQVLKQGRLKHYVLFALFGMLAICTKDQAYGLFLLSPLPILWTRYREAGALYKQKLSWRALLWDRRLLAAALVATATFVVGQNLLFNFSGFLNHLQIIIGPGSSPYAAYAPTISGRFHLLWATSSELALGLTLPIFAICLIGSLFCAFKFPRYSLPLLFLAA